MLLIQVHLLFPWCREGITPCSPEVYVCRDWSRVVSEQRMIYPPSAQPGMKHLHLVLHHPQTCS